MKYLSRIADKTLKNRLKSKGAVLIEGPKWCGKTSTAMQAANSVLNLADLNVLDESASLIAINPGLLLQGDAPKLIDEWQEIPRIWDAVRVEVDRRQAVGQFILTGSALPANRAEIHHSGTGRFSRITMRTMSLYESGESTGSVSLEGLLAQKVDMGGINNKDINDVAKYICRGGWPMSVILPEEVALQQAVDYFEAVVNFDVSRVDGTRRSPLTTNKLLRSYARHIGLQSTLTTLRDDITNGGDSMDISTVTSYINALKKIFVIEEAMAWNPNLRSKTAIRTTETRYFSDPSIGCAALGIGPGDLLKDLKLMGMMFENLCVRDLRVYADALNGQVYHYRDSNGLECDCVVHLKNGNYGLIEVKLGGEKLIEDGVLTLKKLANKIDTTMMPAPSFLMVLTATGNFAYRREDGVWIVPLTCLKDTL